MQNLLGMWPSGRLAIALTPVALCLAGGSGLAEAMAADAPVAAATSADKVDKVDAAIRTLGAIGAQGQGNADATRALQTLADAGPSALLPVLSAFDATKPLAMNYLYNAAEVIASRAGQAKQELPLRDLETFILDTSHHPAARRLAYEIALVREPGLADRLIPGMLLDPGADFRRDAVQRLIDQAQGLSDPKAAQAVLKEALRGATDADQVTAIVTPLREAGETVNLQHHFGFLPTWRVIGPFDNREMKGFDVVYAPEREIGNKFNFSQEYPGKEGPVSWKQFTTTDDYGMLNVARELGPYKGAIVYATTSFEFATDRGAELRLGTPNAWKLWLNGELVFARDEYHRGDQMDQYRLPVKLKAGTNVVVLKLCQNEQKDDWAQDYKFQLRVCDSAGAGLVAITSEATAERDGGTTVR